MRKEKGKKNDKKDSDFSGKDRSSMVMTINRRKFATNRNSPKTTTT